MSPEWFDKKMQNMSSGYKIIDHTGDVGLKIWGTDIPELFCEAAQAMCSLIIENKAIQNERVFDIRVETTDKNELLLKWLREILFIFETEKVVFSQFQIESNNFHETDVPTYFLEAKAYGEVLDVARHEICKEIKAVTRHHFYIKKNGEWWESAVLFDI
ncbi:archease [candidate division KSB1 bacterium]|nr:archease [candidate division KSB1 bacterium]